MVRGNEMGNHIMNFGHEHRQKNLQARQTMTFRPGGVAYDYCEVGREIVVEIGRRTVKNERSDLCAVFYRSLVKEPLHALEWDKATDIVELPTDRLGETYPEQSVLVRIVQVADETKEWRECFVLSVVRLEPLDLSSDSFAEVSQTPLLLPAEEIEGHGDSVYRVVEGGPQIMDTVPSNQGPTFERGFFLDFDDDAVAGGLRITLSDDGVRVAVAPGRDLLLDGFRVFFSPPYFSMHTFKNGHGR